MDRRSLIIGLAVLIAHPAIAATRHHPKHKEAETRLSAEAVNGAEFKKGKPSSALYVRAQVLLDRARYSPGEIDAKDGANFKRALTAFAADHNLKADGRLTPDLWEALKQIGNDPAIINYTTTKADAEGPLVKEIPRKLEEQADLDRLGYTDATEALAEKFHLAPALLKKLNPKAHFDEPGTEIVVPNVTPMATPKSAKRKDAPQVDRVEVDKQALTVRAFDASGKVVAVYPASVGSEEKPAPDGEVEVTRIAYDPDYTYNPKYAFKGVEADKKFTIKPGPNNPVGLVWIALQGEGYGIHGTPEPGNIGKTASHGCVRLANWDALDLAQMVHKGTRVSFINGKPSATEMEPEAKTE